MTNARVLITGGTGFIGGALAARLAQDVQLQVVTSVRAGSTIATPRIEVVEVADISENTDWQSALRNVDVVVHTAAVAHVRNVDAGEQLRRLRATNVDGALNLGRQALSAGVRRFVFVSSIGVNGLNPALQPFNESSPADPQAAYAVSKLDAECALRSMFAGTSVELVVIRPPLVYAAHAPGNFRRLLQAVHLGVPLPFAGVTNQRNIVSLENLVDFIRCCLTHPAAANELFVLGEGTAVSTRDIVRYLACGMERRGWMFAVPSAPVGVLCRALGLGGLYAQLFESLAIDSSKARRLLGWQPIVSTEAGLIEAGKRYRLQRSKKEG